MIRIDPALLERARSVAQQLLATIEGARAVVIATEDGFDVADALAHPVDPARIAAMTSSISAIGQAITAETGLGQPNCLVVDASEGFLIMRRARCSGMTLVINALTDRRVLLGMAMLSVTEAAKQLEAPLAP